jgi:hypothetical protein
MLLAMDYLHEGLETAIDPRKFKRGSQSSVLSGSVLQRFNRHGTPD